MQHQTPGCQIYTAISWVLLIIQQQKWPHGNCLIQHIDPFKNAFFFYSKESYFVCLCILFISSKPLPHILAKVSDSKNVPDRILSFFIWEKLICVFQQCSATLTFFKWKVKLIYFRAALKKKKFVIMLLPQGRWIQYLSCNYIIYFRSYSAIRSVKFYT